MYERLLPNKCILVFSGYILYLMTEVHISQSCIIRTITEILLVSDDSLHWTYKLHEFAYCISLFWSLASLHSYYMNISKALTNKFIKKVGINAILKYSNANILHI